MNLLPYIVFFVVFFVPFLTASRGGLGVLPAASELLFELVSGLCFLAALIYGAYHKSLLVSPKYLFLFLALCLHLAAGIIYNSVDPGVVMAGIRNSLKYTPLFLLPLVYEYSDREVTGQLKFLLILALLQFPLVITQFFILHWPADNIAGTFVIGSTLSVFLVSCIALLGAYYFRKKISVKTFIILSIFLFAPATLNESKGTIILLMFGFLVIMLGANLKRANLMVGLGILAIMMSTFVVVYNIYFKSVAGADGYLSFFTAGPDKGISNYLYSGDSTIIDPKTFLKPNSSLPGALSSYDPEDYKNRRIDAIILPLRVLSNDPARLLLGLGVGNISSSGVKRFSGEYSFISQDSVAAATVSLLLWEIGVLGLLIYLAFFYFIYMDARYLSRVDTFPGAFAHGWTGVTAIILLALPYKNILKYDVLCSLFWYFSGYIAVKSYALKVKNQIHLHESRK